VTTQAWQRRQIFRNETAANIVIQQLAACRDRGFYKLHEFVLMPDHLHVLLTPGETVSLEKAVQMIKGGSARAIGQLLLTRWPVWHSGFHDVDQGRSGIFRLPRLHSIKPGKGKFRRFAH
jgi:putative transposase